MQNITVISEVILFGLGELFLLRRNGFLFLSLPLQTKQTKPHHSAGEFLMSVRSVFHTGD